MTTARNTPPIELGSPTSASFTWQHLAACSNNSVQLFCCLASKHGYLFARCFQSAACPDLTSSSYIYSTVFLKEGHGENLKCQVQCASFYALPVPPSQGSLPPTSPPEHTSSQTTGSGFFFFILPLALGSALLHETASLLPE